MATTCKLYALVNKTLYCAYSFLGFLRGDLYFRVEELRDSTAHAEMICIREASNKLRTWRLSVLSPFFENFIYSLHSF